MLYPLSYEGEISRIARNISLSGTLGQVNNIVRCALGPHLGRTITSIHRFCEAIEVVSSGWNARSLSDITHSF